MISIILPIYNMQDYIKECLESVVNQTYKDIEIICVNDFCMDNSMTIVKKYAQRDGRIKIVHNEKNRGLGGARNAGLENARGEYIIFCDTDDKIMPDFVEKLYININKEEADMSFCDVMLLNADNSLTPYKPFHDMSISNYLAFFPKENFEHFTNIWPSAWNKIYKTSIIKENNIKFLENILYEDHTFYYQYLLCCNKVSHVLEPLYIYRHERPDSIMKETSRRIMEIFTILSHIENVFKPKFDENFCKKLMIKISLRLLWERTMSFNGKARTSIQKDFIKKAHTYMSKYKINDILKYKDSFIDDTLFLKLNPISWFFSKKQEGMKIKYKMFNIKFSKINLKLLTKNIEIIQKENTELRSSIEHLKHKYSNIKDNIDVLVNLESSEKYYTLTSINNNNNSDIINTLNKLDRFYFIPNPGNLGDVVIAQSEYELLNSRNYNYDIVDFESKFLPNKDEFNLVYGGGGLFVKFWGYDNFIKIFKKENLKSCVILPSSFFECDDLLEIFDERFTVFCRERNSYNYCTQNNKKAKFILADDMALFLETSTNKVSQNNLLSNLNNLKELNIFDTFIENYKKYKEVENNLQNAIKNKVVITKNNVRIGYIFRNDEERKILQCVDKKNVIDLSMFSTSSCTSCGDVKLLSELFINAIDSFDVIFTDRLHVGIVATLLGKKVYLIDNIYGKISGVYKYSLCNYSNVEMIENINDIDVNKISLDNVISQILLNKNTNYNDFIAKYLINEKTNSKYINTISKWGNISE